MTVLLRLLQQVKTPAAAVAAQRIGAVRNVAQLVQHKLRHHQLPFQKARLCDIEDTPINNHRRIQQLGLRHRSRFGGIRRVLHVGQLIAAALRALALGAALPKTDESLVHFSKVRRTLVAHRNSDRRKHHIQNGADGRGEQRRAHKIQDLTDQRRNDQPADQARYAGEHLPEGHLVHLLFQIAAPLHAIVQNAVAQQEEYQPAHHAGRGIDHHQRPCRDAVFRVGKGKQLQYRRRQRRTNTRAYQRDQRPQQPLHLF